MLRCALPYPPLSRTSNFRFGQDSIAISHGGGVGKVVIEPKWGKNQKAYKNIKMGVSIPAQFAHI